MYTSTPESYRDVWICRRIGGSNSLQRFSTLGVENLKILNKYYLNHRAFPSAKHEDILLDRMLRFGVISLYERKKIFLPVSEIRLDKQHGSLTQKFIYYGKRNSS